MKTLQTLKIIKIGSSLGVTLPSRALSVMGIFRGDYMGVSYPEEGTIVLKKVVTLPAVNNSQNQNGTQ